MDISGFSNEPLNCKSESGKYKVILARTRSIESIFVWQFEKKNLIEVVATTWRPCFL